MQIPQNYNYTTNFQAYQVASVKSVKDKIVLLQIDKKHDKKALQNLLNSFFDGSIKKKFPNTLQGAMKEFIKNAFASIDKDGMKGIISVKDDIPTGLITYNINVPQKEIYIDFLASWIPQGLKKVKNNGKMLVSHVYQDALNTGMPKVTVTPGFTSLPFYEKLGFRTSNNKTFINLDKIKNQIQSLNQDFTYTKVPIEIKVDLNV